jgi:hypothetical protein
MSRSMGPTESLVSCGVALQPGLLKYRGDRAIGGTRCGTWLVLRALNFCRRAPDESDDRHQYSAPDTTAEDTGDQRSDVETPGCGGAERLENRRANSTPKNAGDGIPHCTEALVFKNRASDVAPDGAANEINNETDDIHNNLAFLKRFRADYFSI